MALTNFYDELETAIQYRPDYHKVYDAMGQTFKRCLNQETRQTRINFAGDFAKTDYLLKEHDAPGRLAKNINDTRVRLRKRAELSVSELERFCLYDLKHLCQFFAFIYQTDIPEHLVALFPTNGVPSFNPLLVGECMRVIVEQWDDEMVYVQTEKPTEEGGLRKVCYSKGNSAYAYDWTYLKEMFHRGAQLNLVRPREDDGIIYPELIIYEPDYLVNVSTVAHCFTNYADSPLVDLIKKLEPQGTTEAMVLGNLAGQLLDESIHQLPNTHSYAESVKDFFKDHAISLLTADVSNEFHQNAQRQKQNITQAIHVTLPAKLGHFNSKDGIVEPSFFSEMLGLQGRMDYLQQDFRILMEQKSGKGAFPYNNFVTPRQTDEHYVQMLLYMALIRYNYNDIYERNRGVQAFLLYSKYNNSLLGLGFAPELIFKAIKVRNELAWTELLYTQPDGYKILNELSPDLLNLKQARNVLWTKWQRPQIAGVLDSIHQASALEKAYYFRFLTFIANEHVMSKMGGKTEENSGFAATWHDSLDEKRQAGNIHDKLILISPNKDTKGRIRTIELRFSETETADMANFRVGDIVILYPYTEGMEPDARKTMVFRCTIEAILPDIIRLSMRSAQSDNRFFIAQQNKLWAIEHDFMESSFSPLYKGMQAFLTAPKERLDLLLLQREPQIGKTVTLNGNYNNFNDLSVRVKRAKDLFLIIGPPGTGKTSYGLLYTVKEELQEQDSSVLLLAYTNRAVDEICSKLVQEGIDFIRIGSMFSCADDYKDKLLSSKVQQSTSVAVLKNTLLSARVIVGTTASLNSNISLFQLKQFSLAVIDEASQILEPHLIGLLCAHNNGTPAIKKFVLIGDHKQLPAVVQQTADVSCVQDDILNDIYLTDCRLSLFERLLKKYARNENVTYMLKKQGRMHHDIALFPNLVFYNNQLEEVPLPHQNTKLPLRGGGTNGIEEMLRTRRVAFIAAESPKNSPSDKVNQTEADIIAAIVANIYEIEKTDGFDVNKTVGVIVPYRNQIATVRKMIDKYGIPLLHDVTIDTVERYQGSQRQYIIYGFTIQKNYQLNFLTSNVFEDEIDGCTVDRKLNVAMTRAEEHLIMVGNPELLSTNVTFSKLMAFVRDKQGYFHIKKDDFISGNFMVP